ncbi:MAG: NHL repeat-containing protein, partial [bacterium]
SQAVKNAMTYNIWVSTSPGIDCTSPPAATYSTGPLKTSYVDTNIVQWTTYYYVITAVNNSVFPAEESACSNEASAAAIEPAWTLLSVCGEDSNHYLPPADPSRFNRPMDAVVDSDGYVYVADTDNHRVKKINLDCVYKSHWGGLGNANGEFKKPTGIALYNDEIYVVDNYDRVQVFTKGGVYKRKWYVQFPLDIEVDPGGTVYVSTEADSIMTYNTTGTYLGKFTVYNPRGIAVDGAFLYVASASDNTVKVIDPGTGLVDKTLGSSGTGFGQLVFPYDVDVDPSGVIFVADGLQNDRIQMFNADGSVNNVIPASCPASSMHTECYMDKPLGVGLAPTGELVVMDTYGGRVLIFSPPPP